MKVMVIVKASPESEAGQMASQELLAAMGKFNEELVQAGIMLSGEGLQPSSKGARVRFSGKQRTVIDGPFAETKELIAGFWIWQVKSLAEAIDWVKRCPNPMESDSEIEIRPFFTADDFGEAFTPELRVQEARLRARTMGLGEIRFEDGQSMQIAGFNETYNGETRVNIPRQWERFAPLIGSVPGQLAPAAYGVCWNCGEDGRFDYLTGVEVSGAAKLSGGFQTVQIPARRYAVFTHAGHVSKIPETLETIWKQWLPESGFNTSDAPSFERYTEEFDPATGQGGIEIWVPIS